MPKEDIVQFYAHSDRNSAGKLPGDPGCRWQTLREHLICVARLATRFANEACPNDRTFARAVKWAAFLHDAGKYSEAFQRMLIESAQGKAKTRTRHSVYGAAYAMEARAYHIALAVLGHHAGLHAGMDLKSRVTSQDREEAKRLIHQKAAPDKLGRLSAGRPPALSSNVDFLSTELRIRMLFSCLIDADRLDCLRHEKGHLPHPPRFDASEKLGQLLDYIGQRSAEAQPGKVNDARQTILKACLDAACFEERLLSLTVPTGGGKTLASMAFALRRAVLRPEEIRRVIVVVPFLSIIEQNAQVYADAMGTGAILEHHSGDFGRLKRIKDRFIQPEVDDSLSDYEEWNRELATENWDAPIVITTSVRFFESLFSNRPSDLRRLHNIARSVVILDEVQTLPKGFIGTILSMMRGLAEEWNTTFVFCTATQPAFEKSRSCNDNDIRWAAGSIKPVITEDLQRQLFCDLKRVRDPKWPKADEKRTWDQIADEIQAQERVLCIVNTRRHALELYEKVVDRATKSGSDSSNIFHLSTRMCAMHRLDTIEQIRDIMDATSEPCQVISTQLVEAGVNLDFPVVYRAMGPFDSIVQAAGRCDREGKMTAVAGEPAGRLIVFQPEDDQTPYREATGITQGLIERGSLSIHDPAHMRIYFDELYEDDLDPDSIEGLRRNLDFPEIAERFAMIDDRTKAILVPFNHEAQRLIGEIERSRGLDRGSLRKAQRFQVGLYPGEFEEARELGAIVELWEGSDLWKCLPSCYSPEVGLQIRRPSPEDYMVVG